MDATRGYPGDRDYIIQEAGCDGDPAAELERMPRVDGDMLPSEYSEHAVDPPTDRDGTPHYADTDPLGSSGESTHDDKLENPEPTSPNAAGSFVAGEEFIPLQADSPAAALAAMAGKDLDIQVLHIGAQYEQGPTTLIADTREEAEDLFTPEGIEEGRLHAVRRPRDFMVRKFNYFSVFDGNNLGIARPASANQTMAAVSNGNKSSIATPVDTYHQALDQLRWVVGTGQAYGFDVHKQSTNIETFLTPDILATYHNPKSQETFREAHEKLFEAGFRSVINHKRTHEDVIAASRQMFDGIYAQAANIRNVYRNPIGVARGIVGSQMDSKQRFAVMQAARTLNSVPKDPVLAEFMQQCAPRFTWDGHTLPDDLSVPEGYQAQLENLWRVNTLEEADYLTSPFQIAEGKTPFHKAFQTADAVASDGHPGIAYVLKANVLIESLNREIDKMSGPGTDVKGELLFLNFIVPGALSGELGLPAKHAHFDYAGGIQQLFNETWVRVEKGNEGDEEDYSLRFLDRIHEIYNEEFRPYLAQSLVSAGNRGTVDTVAVLRELKNTEKPWAQALIDCVTEMPDRPILTNEEAGTFATASLPETTVVAPERVDEAVGRFSHEGDTDLYSFKMPLSDIAQTPRGVTATVHVDIQPTNGSVLATINYKGNGITRQVPLTIDPINGEVNLTTIDSEPLDTVTAERYKSIIETAIVTHDEQKQAAEAEAHTTTTARTLGSTSVGATTSTTPQVVQQQRTKERIKTRGIPHATDEISGTQAPEQPAVPLTGRVRVTGTSSERIAGLLDSQRIRGMSADSIALKVAFLVGVSQQTGASFGKRPVTDRKNTVKIRQVNLSDDGRRIRLFFEEGDNDLLTLEGIFDKGRDDTAKETQYLRKLLKRLTPDDPSNRGR